MLAHRAALFAAIAVTACGGQARGPGGSDLPEPVATASLFDTSGTRVGLATFTVSGGEARLGISVSGLSPGNAWARMAVRVPPGSKALTLSGRFSVSCAQERVSASTAALDAA